MSEQPQSRRAKAARELKREREFLNSIKSETFPNESVKLTYFRLYNELFHFENLLRIVVYVVLKAKFGAQWDGIQVGTSESGSVAIKSLFEKRRMDQSHGHIGAPVYVSLMHLTGFEISAIITADDERWSLFQPVFGMSRSAFVRRLEEVWVIRNAVAHFRAVTANDLNLLREVSAPLSLKMKEYVDGLIGQLESIPSNHEVAWARDLAAMRKEHVAFDAEISKNGRWCVIMLGYRAVFVGARGSPFKEITFTYLNDEGILSQYPQIQGNCVCLLNSMGIEGSTPEHPLDGIDLDDVQRLKGSPFGWQTMRIIFPKGAVKKSWNALKGEFEHLASTASGETREAVKDEKYKGTLIGRDKIDPYDLLDAPHDEESDEWGLYLPDQPLGGYRESPHPENWGYMGEMVRFVRDGKPLEYRQSNPWMRVPVTEAHSR